MEITTKLQILKNSTLTIEDVSTTYRPNDSVESRAHNVLFIHSAVAAVGILANLTVIVVFLNHKKLRTKIPNIFIINQVRQKIISMYKTFFLLMAR